MGTNLVANPFQGSEVVAKPQTDNAMVMAAQQREATGIQTQLMIAKRFPRDQIAVMDRILNTCTRPSLAEKAVYAYARGGTEITGPSIRLAEAIAQNWGNLDYGIRELDQQAGVSTVEAYCLDLETNTRQSKVFKVKHERSTKAKGRYMLEDSRDIYELVANQGARRLRACILGIIPGDVVETAVKQCEATLKTRIQINDELIKSILDKFAPHKVTQAMIEAKIQRRISSILPAQVLTLGNIVNSLNDGMSVPADWFDTTTAEPEAESKGDAIKEKLKAKEVAQPTEALSQAEPATHIPPTNPVKVNPKAQT